MVVKEGLKGPIGFAWGKKGLTAAETTKRLTNNPKINLGVILGPVTGIIDFDCDGPGAYEYLRDKIFGGTIPETPWWESSRGRHVLFSYHPRFATALPVFTLNGLEFRLAHDEKKQFQSLIPPSTTDGFTRVWGADMATCELATVPELAVDNILAASAEYASTCTTAPTDRSSDYTPDYTPDLMFANIEAAQQKAKVEKLERYFDRAGRVTKIGSKDRVGRIFVRLDRCPFKPDGEEHRDGDAAVIVNSDGSHAWACRHSKCSDKHWDDVEKIYGSLCPTIKIGVNLQEMCNVAIAALADVPNVYQRGGNLVEITQDAPQPRECKFDNKSPKLRVTPFAKLNATLSDQIKWLKFNKQSRAWQPSLPHDKVCAAIDVAGEWPGIPLITGIVSAPPLRQDGSIATTPGFDTSTGLYLNVDGEFPPLMNVDDALNLLLDVIVDFPFVTLAHRSAWLAALLTLLARSAITGSTPMFFFDANRSRTGKGLATDVLTLIAEGRKANRYTYPGGDGAEVRKLITSVAVAAPPYFLFDNVKGKFGGEALENALTTARWSDRILAVNKSIDVTLNWTWLATGNAAILTPDMVGRTCHCRMETPLEHPELREGFRHRNLIGYVQEHRHKLAIAALSIISGYIKAGRPDMKLSTWGGFEEWSDLIRGSLVWAKQPDPGDTRAGLVADADDETQMQGAVVDAWAELGMTCSAREAIEFVQNCIPVSGEPDKFPKMRAVLDELPDRDKHLALGILLRDSKGRNFGGRMILRTDTKIRKWFVKKVT